MYHIINCVTGCVNGRKIPDLGRQFISSFGNNESREMNVLSVSQLQRLFQQSCTLERMPFRNRYHFSGE